MMMYYTVTSSAGPIWNFAMDDSLSAAYIAAQEVTGSWGDPSLLTVTSAAATQAQDPNWQYLRSQRDSLLASCDWTQISDSPLSSDDKASWATYRAALRNLPSNTTDPTNPSWPTQPA